LINPPGHLFLMGEVPLKGAGCRGLKKKKVLSFDFRVPVFGVGVPSFGFRAGKAPNRFWQILADLASRGFPVSGFGFRFRASCFNSGQSKGFDRLGGVPRQQKMLKGHLPTVIYHQVY